MRGLLQGEESREKNYLDLSFAGLKCSTETKMQILYDYVDHTPSHTVEIECQMVQLLSTYIVESTMFINLTPA